VIKSVYLALLPSVPPKMYRIPLNTVKEASALAAAVIVNKK
jgi:hypothetical protein